MPCPVIERLSGTINGFNTIFETSRPYVAGSVKVFINGLLGEGSLVDGWTEQGGKIIKLKSAPRPEEIVQAYYIPR